MFSLNHYEFIVQYWCRTDKRWYNHLTTESREAALDEVAYNCVVLRRTMLEEGCAEGVANEWHTKDEIRVMERKIKG